jgi:hypothetical protein
MPEISTVAGFTMNEFDDPESAAPFTVAFALSVIAPTSR